MLCKSLEAALSVFLLATSFLDWFPDKPTPSFALPLLKLVSTQAPGSPSIVLAINSRAQARLLSFSVLSRRRGRSRSPPGSQGPAHPIHSRRSPDLRLLSSGPESTFRRGNSEPPSGLTRILPVRSSCHFWTFARNGLTSSFSLQDFRDTFVDLSSSSLGQLLPGHLRH